MTTYTTIRSIGKAVVLTAAIGIAATPVMAKTRNLPTAAVAGAYASQPSYELRNTPNWGYWGGASYQDVARLDRQMNRGF